MKGDMKSRVGNDLRRGAGCGGAMGRGFWRRGRYNARMLAPRRIVVVLPNWIGDVVMATPALAALRSGFGDAHIAVFGRKMALETLSGLATFDEMLTRPATGRGMMDVFAAVNLLRHGDYDLAVLLPNSFRSALTARLAGIGRIGGYARDWRNWLLTDKLAPRRDEEGEFEAISAVDYYLQLADMLGAPAMGRQLGLAVGQAGLRQADQVLAAAGADPDRPIVMLNPGAAFGVSKMWEPVRYAALADALIDRHGAQIVINAAPNERSIAADVAEAMNNRPLISFADRDNTISQLKGLIRRSALVITGDTGARHLAAGLGVSVVTLFGSTDPRWSSIDCPRERIIRVDVPCSPCQKKICPLPAGPHYHQCMSAITVEMVLPAAEELLGVVLPDGDGNGFVTKATKSTEGTKNGEDKETAAARGSRRTDGDGNGDGNGLATKDTKDTKDGKDTETATAKGVKGRNTATAKDTKTARGLPREGGV